MDVLTPWFPPSIKPVHAGQYLTRLNSSDVMPTLALWDGQRWIGIEGGAWLITRWEWKGLAFDPSRAVECSDAETGEPGMWVPKT